MKFKSNMEVDYITHSGDDNLICNAARVSTGNDTAGYEESKGLINYLWREGHTSPFEHVFFTFKVGVPFFIARQIQRHRTFSYNEISGRYSELTPEFWLPYEDRPLNNIGSGAYPELVQHEDHKRMHSNVCTILGYHSADANKWYNQLLAEGVATEVARSVLPMNTYTYFYMSGTLKNFLDFIDKRTVNNAQLEVQEVALGFVDYLDKYVPLTMKAWRNNG